MLLRVRVTLSRRLDNQVVLESLIYQCIPFFFHLLPGKVVSTEANFAHPLTGSFSSTSPSANLMLVFTSCEENFLLFLSLIYRRSRTCSEPQPESWLTRLSKKTKKRAKRGKTTKNKFSGLGLCFFGFHVLYSKNTFLLFKNVFFFFSCFPAGSGLHTTKPPRWIKVMLIGSGRRETRLCGC